MCMRTSRESILGRHQSKTVLSYHRWLSKNKKIAGDMNDFKKKLDSIWFGLYRRQIHNDSSGFEHVFLGEEKDVRYCRDMLRWVLKVLIN